MNQEVAYTRMDTIKRINDTLSREPTAPLLNILILIKRMRLSNKSMNWFGRKTLR